MTDMERAEKRRVRRGRALSVQAGQGHGDPIYLPVRVRNRMVTAMQLEKRREVLARRDELTQAYITGLRRREAKRQNPES